jgi:site-specific DNA-adenine methylase
MFWINRSLCSARLISNNLIRCFPRIATSNERSTVEKTSDYAVINSSQQPQTVVFNDYNIIKPVSTEIRSRPVPKSVPKLIDIQTGLNHFMNECDERTLLITIENKYKLFDSNNVATFIQRLHQLNIKRDSNEKHHQRFYDFVDYFSKIFELPMIKTLSLF